MAATSFALQYSNPRLDINHLVSPVCTSRSASLSLKKQYFHAGADWSKTLSNSRLPTRRSLNYFAQSSSVPPPLPPPSSCPKTLSIITCPHNENVSESSVCRVKMRNDEELRWFLFASGSNALYRCDRQGYVLKDMDAVISLEDACESVDYTLASNTGLYKVGNKFRTKLKQEVDQNEIKEAAAAAEEEEEEEAAGGEGEEEEEGAVVVEMNYKDVKIRIVI